MRMRNVGCQGTRAWRGDVRSRGARAHCGLPRHKSLGGDVRGSGAHAQCGLLGHRVPAAARYWQGGGEAGTTAQGRSRALSSSVPSAASQEAGPPKSPAPSGQGWMWLHSLHFPTRRYPRKLDACPRRLDLRLSAAVIELELPHALVSRRPPVGVAVGRMGLPHGFKQGCGAAWPAVLSLFRLEAPPGNCLLLTFHAVFDYGWIIASFRFSDI